MFLLLLLFLYGLQVFIVDNMTNLQQLKDLEQNENTGLILLKVMHPETKEWVLMTDEQRHELQQARRADLETSNSLDTNSGVRCKIGLCAPTNLVYKDQMICFHCQGSSFHAYLIEIGIVFPATSTFEDLRALFPLDYTDFLDRYRVTNYAT